MRWSLVDAGKIYGFDLCKDDFEASSAGTVVCLETLGSGDDLNGFDGASECVASCVEHRIHKWVGGRGVGNGDVENWD